MQAQQAVLVACLSVSLVASGASCGYYLWDRNERLKDMIGRSMFSLHLSGTVASCAWIFNILTRLCPHFVPACHMSMLWVAAWTCAIGLVVVLTAAGSPHFLVKYEKALHVVCWVIPAVFGSIPLAVSGIRVRRISGCWMNPDVGLYAFSVPYFTLFAFNLSLMGTTVYYSNRNRQELRRSEVYVSNQRMRVLSGTSLRLFLMQLCFLATTLASALQYIEVQAIELIGIGLTSLLPAINALLSNYGRMKEFFVSKCLKAPAVEIRRNPVRPRSFTIRLEEMLDKAELDLQAEPHLGTPPPPPTKQPSFVSNSAPTTFPKVLAKENSLQVQSV